MYMYYANKKCLLFMKQFLSESVIISNILFNFPRKLYTNVYKNM